MSRRVAAIPEHGLGHGLLGRLHPDPEVRRAMAALPRARVTLQYRTRIDALSRAEALFPVLDHRSADRSKRPREREPGIVFSFFFLRLQEHT